MQLLIMRNNKNWIKWINKNEEWFYFNIKKRLKECGKINKFEFDKKLNKKDNLKNKEWRMIRKKNW